jgi:putative tricarboxylic transport membrane protein
MERFNFPTTPVIIALVLGVPAEYNLRIALLISHGDPTVLVTRPVSIVIILAILALVGRAIVASWRERRNPQSAAA